MALIDNLSNELLHLIVEDLSPPNRPIDTLMSLVLVNHRLYKLLSPASSTG